MSPALPEFPANVAQHVMSARGGGGDKGLGHRMGGRRLEVTHELSLEGGGACQWDKKGRGQTRQREQLEQRHGSGGAAGMFWRAD